MELEIIVGSIIAILSIAVGVIFTIQIYQYEVPFAMVIIVVIAALILMASIFLHERKRKS